MSRRANTMTMDRNAECNERNSRYAHMANYRLFERSWPPSRSGSAGTRMESGCYRVKFRESPRHRCPLSGHGARSHAGCNRPDTSRSALLDQVLMQSASRIVLDLDVTASTRQGYFGNIAAGPRFVENRFAQWKAEREAIYRGTILPIGEAPDGTTWTGFASVAKEGRGGYLLLFRELNPEATWVAPRSLFAPGRYQIRMLGGAGSVTQTSDGSQVVVPHQLGFVWAKLESTS